MPLIKTYSRRPRNAYIKTHPEGQGEKKRRHIQLKFIDTIKNFHGIKKICGGVLLLACLVGASVLMGSASIWLYNTAVTSSFFQTKHIDVTGNIRLSKEMILQYSGIKEGENSLAVNISDAERELRRTPWVKEASIKRLLPDRFVIKLQERLPSFWLRKDGILYYANELGVPIAPVESINFLSLPTLIIEPGAEEIVSYLSRMLQDIQNKTLPIESGVIAQVTASATGSVEIYLEDREMRLSIATDDWNGNLTKMGLALGDLARRRELQNVRQLQAINGNVWVLFNKAQQG